jgi:hypothetical protein
MVLKKLLVVEMILEAPGNMISGLGSAKGVFHLGVKMRQAGRNNPSRWICKT